MDQSPPPSAAFRCMYDETVEAIRRYCHRRLQAAEADDAAAEVYLVAWRRIDQMPAGDAALLWLYGVARNVIRNQRRSTRRQMRLRAQLQADRRPAMPDAATQVLRKIEDQEVIDALARLSPSDRELLRLAAWEELKPAQIGAVLGITPHAASMRLTRARNRLARRLHMRRSPRNVSTVPQPQGQGGER